MLKVSGLEQFDRRLDRITSQEGLDAVLRGLFAAGNIIETDAERSITQGSISGAGHVPSLPGEPPNRDTGVLDNNIETVVTGPLSVEVQSNAPYAAALEFGTSRIAPRPYMRPAAEKNREKTAELVADELAKVVNKG